MLMKLFEDCVVGVVRLRAGKKFQLAFNLKTRRKNQDHKMLAATRLSLHKPQLSAQHSRPLAFNASSGRMISRRSYASAVKYTPEHEWISVDGTTATVGISDFAQNALGEVVYCDLPSVKASVAQKEVLASVESVKTASDVYSPVEGTVIEVNEKLRSEPTLLNKSAQSEGWIAKLQVKDNFKDQIAKLMDEGAYKKYCEGLDH